MHDIEKVTHKCIIPWDNIPEHDINVLSAYRWGQSDRNEAQFGGNIRLLSALYWIS